MYSVPVPPHDGQTIETLMDDGAWEEAVATKLGAGDPAEVGGDGWMLCQLCQYDELCWWAAPGEWRQR